MDALGARCDAANPAYRNSGKTPGLPACKPTFVISARVRALLLGEGCGVRPEDIEAAWQVHGLGLVDEGDGVVAADVGVSEIEIAHGLESPASFPSPTGPDVGRFALASGRSAVWAVLYLHSWVVGAPAPAADQSCWMAFLRHT